MVFIYFFLPTVYFVYDERRVVASLFHLPNPFRNAQAEYCKTFSEKSRDMQKY